MHFYPPIENFECLLNSNIHYMNKLWCCANSDMIILNYKIGPTCLSQSPISQSPVLGLEPRTLDDTPYPLGSFSHHLACMGPSTEFKCLLRIWTHGVWIYNYNVRQGLEPTTFLFYSSMVLPMQYVPASISVAVTVRMLVPMVAFSHTSSL